MPATQIKLSNGAIALVSPRDASRVQGYVWHQSDKGYVVANVKQPDGTYRQVRLHRLLLNAMPDVEVDHCNRDKLDNQRGNLREATRSEQLRNTKKRRDNTSGYRGVWFNKQSGCFRAEVTVLGKHLSLGNYRSARKAAEAYDAFASRFFGSFATLNLA